MDLCTFKTNWKKKKKRHFYLLLTRVIVDLAVWKYPSIPRKSLYSLDPLVLLRLWLRRKRKAGCSADEALGLVGPDWDLCMCVFIHLVSISQVRTHKEGSGGGVRSLSILGNLLICAFEANSISLATCQYYYTRINILSVTENSGKQLPIYMGR